jgi:hypothetical protein
MLPAEFWPAAATVLAAAATTVGAVSVAKIGKTNSRVQAIEATSEEARDLSRPTGNGFARTVLDSLAEIKSDVREVRADIAEDRRSINTHLQDHARSAMSTVPQQANAGS